MSSKVKKICITNRFLVENNFINQIQKITSLDVDFLILREKDLSIIEYEQLAKQVIAVCKDTHTRCILHTFVEVAKELNYPYIHLPMKEFECLSSLDKSFFHILGVSTHSVEEAIRAEKLGATYITASHIFETNCKKGIPPQGLSYLKDVVEAVSIDVYALGGIHLDNMHLCIEQGVDGICMMSEYATC